LLFPRPGGLARAGGLGFGCRSRSLGIERELDVDPPTPRSGDRAHRAVDFGQTVLLTWPGQRLSGSVVVASKILIIVGDGGESYETWFAVHRFQEAGWEPVVAAPSRRRLHLVIHDFEPGWDTYKEREGYAMDADLAFDDIAVGDYDAVLCIGGRSPEYLRNDRRVLDALREFDRQGKWIFAICHGVQLVAAAGLLQGKRVTCYEHVKLEAEAAGATFVPARAVRDGRLVTAQTWREHPEFYREVFACVTSAVPA
jgi:protease I